MAIAVKAKNPTNLNYCRNCRSSNTWQRCKAQDIYSESGKLMWKAYRCRICGATTIVFENPLKIGDKRA